MTDIWDDSALAVEQRVADGWRPALGDRRWVRGGVQYAEGEDRDAAEEFDEWQPMSADEEQALVRRRHSPGDDDAEFVMVDDRSGQDDG